MSELVERAKAALEGVTRGPWKLGNRRYPDVVHTPHGCLWNPTPPGGINDPADGEFIAAARSLVPELLAELAAAEQKLAAIRKLAEREPPLFSGQQFGLAVLDILDRDQP